jgi:hypothetical protein
MRAGARGAVLPTEASQGWLTAKVNALIAFYLPNAPLRANAAKA